MHSIPDLGKTRLVYGLKLKTERQKKEWTLKQLAQKAGVSVSFISQIEKGEKYPNLEKQLRFAAALEIPAHQLVPFATDDSFSELTNGLSSDLVSQFPFQLFGIDSTDVVDLLTRNPEKGGILTSTIRQIRREYEVEKEGILHIALKEYQRYHKNYFDEIEERADDFRRHILDVGDYEDVTDEMLRFHLEGPSFNYDIDDTTLTEKLPENRWVCIPNKRPKLFINGNLSPERKAFIYATGIGYNVLGIGSKKRRYDSENGPESIEQALNDYKAAYFASALLLNKYKFKDRFKRFLNEPRFSEKALRKCISTITPQTFFYRLSELMPQMFGIHDYYFLRVDTATDDQGFRVNKSFNMTTSLPSIRSINPLEHFCRRWASIEILKEEQEFRKQHVSREDVDIVIRCHRSKHLILKPAGTPPVELLVLSIGYRPALSKDITAAVSMAFEVTPNLRSQVAFIDQLEVDDPREVYLSCERCPLAASGTCEAKPMGVTPRIYEIEHAQQQQRLKVKEFIERQHRLE